MMGIYVPYHMHSDFSLLDSATKFSDYVDASVKNGFKAIASTEHGLPRGWFSKKQYCDKAGIKFIYGVEIYLTEALLNSDGQKVRDNYHTVLLARNKDGIKEINKLVLLSTQPDHFYYTNRISFDEFLNISDNIISTSACLASPLNKLSQDHPRYIELVKKYDYLEIQPHNHPEQIAFNKLLNGLGRKYGKELIAGTDTHSLNKYKADCRQILLEAKRKSYGDEDSFDLSFKTYDELCGSFEEQSALPDEVWLEAINTTNDLSKIIADFELDTSIKYPILYGDRESDKRMFISTAVKKFQEKLDAGIIPKEQEQAFRDAMDEEVRVFRKLNMEGFMLSMSELISWCKDQGMAIGPARGSVGGSRIAYVTDIIDLNPETWHTIFSRFCNEDRVEVGDIDIDCVEEDRPKIFEYIINRFGQEKTARVASYGTLKEKNIIDDVGRALARRWLDAHPDNEDGNPYSLKNVEKIKRLFDENPDMAKEEYPDLFYFFDGLVGTKISQSVHPAGMVISPVTLDDNYGMFLKDGEMCLMLDMEEVHDAGLVKYDFLVLKTVQVIRDCCNYIGVPYPKTHEIDWDDKAVWESMLKSPIGIFQMEGDYAFQCLKKFKPQSIFDMSLVTASIRPTGASYRDKLLSRIPHKNPSEMIDRLLENNLGYLVYQEDTIAFLQQICGLSGSEADNIRRAIGRKQKDRLDAAMPKILSGYCEKSDKPTDVAEQEAKEFLQVIEDSASYQFGYNHSIAYCLLGYLCAYYRHYYPIEFITSFLNNAKNDADITNGTTYAKIAEVKIVSPKFGISRSEYFFNKERRTIAKGMSSIKFMSKDAGMELYDLAHKDYYTNSESEPSFIDLLFDIDYNTSINSRQLDILIKLDFFSDFGNQNELVRTVDIFNTFKQGKAKQMKKELVDGTEFGDIIARYSDGKTKNGDESKSYKLLNVYQIMKECEARIKDAAIEDISVGEKMKNFEEYMGYAGYVSGKQSDQNKLFIRDIRPLKRKKDGKVFAYSIATRSIGSGKESEMTCMQYKYAKEPVEKGDIIACLKWSRNRGYFQLDEYRKVDENLNYLT